MKKIIVAIDGYSGCGKSTTAKAVAKVLQYTYLDSGAMYRAVTLYFLRNNTDLSGNEEVKKALKNIKITFHFNEAKGIQEIFMNGENVESEIRGMAVSTYVSQVSKLSIVRQAMVDIQRRMGNEKGIVMDGRDIGTVVFPDAELKIFMTADTTIRAERRQKELLEKGEKISLDIVKQNLESRDKIDSGRSVSPLKKAIDAVEIDTSYLDFKEQVSRIIELAKERMN
ncbi:MAG: (d)CMP kinase [Cytophagales bacterium]|uniref:Cytidylate kinase n=2 Tax=Cyclobacterium marinum TaxID=104 RepID=G0IZT2_CYCMS|nr:(d)CMP kinase [Cyclobacterium marinum]AEL25746.1 Cytidylate kinase [Cyclobacterium marinum DSM 745]MBR9773926.1 (d)CMP kinase [Cytophagales bacterium]|tara:strand:+ start:58167 stop:58844 length:678 start_codon:yes stop_codon:yes gene_type:complete